MSKRLQDKAIIVVGAGTKGEGVGNGKAAAIQFAREGAKVLCVDRESALAESTADTIRDEGGTAHPLVADIVEPSDCDHAVDACLDHFGRVDVLHNNVGVTFGGEIVNTSEEDWDKTFDPNVKGMFMMCKRVIPRMMEQGGGSIINISTISSIRPVPLASYTASKGAVNSLTLYIARRYARYNIRANALLLGYIDTPLVRPVWQDEKIRETNLRQVPMRRFASPWEVATVAAFLASDEASYVTGVLLPVDGGLSVTM